MTQIEWVEGGQQRSALWRSESGWPAPKKVAIADDTMSADTAYRLALDGTALLWRGDFQNARQLVQAAQRRLQQQQRAQQQRQLALQLRIALAQQRAALQLAQVRRMRACRACASGFGLRV